MSWDVDFVGAESSMGSKAAVREKFLAACEQILGTAIPREGPTEVPIDDSFRYATLFLGSKHAVEMLCLSIKILDGDPHHDDSHPARTFIRRVTEQTGWQARDSFNGEAI